MLSFENYSKEVYQLLEYDDYQNLIKKLIDLTLDTQSLSFYKRTSEFLDWIDTNSPQKEKFKEKSGQLLDDILSNLSQKKITSRQNLINIKDLTKKYTNSHFELGPISFNISEGEIIGLVGENGNGKTTLLRALCGELLPSNGEIQYLFDYSNTYDLRTKLTYIPQRTKDWHGSLLSNLQFTAASYGIFGEENKYLVELVIARMGLRKYRSFNWQGLSSGYKMRFELARMLLRKPQLLLIDEPLANLDILAQQVVLDDFRNIAKSPFRPLGIVLSSQQLYEVEKTSDFVIFLKEGKPNLNDKRFPQVSPDAEHKKPSQLIIEFESVLPQEELRNLFAPISLEKLQIKGGTYIAIFPESVNQDDFLRIVVDNKVSINYFRNISHSTRRFFLS